jgi:DNA-directed RNA polymerase subunit RPC12/RpoP
MDGEAWRVTCASRDVIVCAVHVQDQARGVEVRAFTDGTVVRTGRAPDVESARPSRRNGWTQSEISGTTAYVLNEWVRARRTLRCAVLHSRAGRFRRIKGADSERERETDRPASPWQSAPSGGNAGVSLTSMASDQKDPPRATGLVCRECKEPVVLIDQRVESRPIFRCPSCGHQWSALDPTGKVRKDT